MVEFGDVTMATRMRDAIIKIAREAVETVRPSERYGRVIDVNRFTGQATVLLNGDIDPITVRMSTNVQPMFTDNNAGVGNGSMVLVAGAFGNYWVRQIISGQAQSIKEGLAHPRLIGGSFLQAQTANYDTVGPVSLQAIGNTTHFGRWDNTNSFGGAGIAFLHVVLKWTFFTGNIKYYTIPLRNNATNGVWQRLAALMDSGDNNGNDMQLEIMADASGFELRARRMAYFGGGLTPGGMSIDVWTHGDAFDYVTGSAIGEEASTVPTRFFGTDASSFQKGPFISPGQNIVSASQDMLTGGTDLTYDGTNVTWTQVMHISGLGANQYLPFGYIDIAAPVSGVPVPIYGKTATPTTRNTITNGIALAAGEFLYCEPPWGDTSTSSADAATLRIVGRITFDRYFEVPSHWICIGYVEQAGGGARFFSMVKSSVGSIPFAQAVGTAAYNLNAVSNVNVTITFPTGRFTVAPRVFAGHQSAGGGTQNLTMRPFNITTTGCTINVATTGLTVATVTGETLAWEAIQMLGTAASG
jgi:hypothetical protein